MNNQIRTQEEVITIIEKCAEQYGDLKFLHEIQTTNLNESFKLEICELQQELKEEFVSKRLLEYIRRDYDKKLKLNGIEPHEVAKSDKELPEILFVSIMRSITVNGSNSSQFYKDTYLDAKELIIKYYTRYFEMKSLTKQLKEEQSKELSELVQEIKYDGIAFYMVVDIYSKVRSNLRTKDKSPKEYECFTQIHNKINDKMLDNMERIRKEMLIDYKAKIEVTISRKESIERIEYIETRIDLEKFDILKEEWAVSEDRYFVLDIKDKAHKIKRTIDYYKNEFDSLTTMNDEDILKILELPGIRLKKNHTYIIKIKD